MGFPKMLVVKKPGVGAEIVQANVGLRVLFPLPLNLLSLPSLFWVAMCQPTNLSRPQFLLCQMRIFLGYLLGRGEDKMASGAKAPGVP